MPREAVRAEAIASSGGCGNIDHENDVALQESPLALLMVSAPVPMPSNAPVGAPGVNGKMTPSSVPAPPKVTRASADGTTAGAAAGT